MREDATTHLLLMCRNVEGAGGSGSSGGNSNGGYSSNNRSSGGAKPAAEWPF